MREFFLNFHSGWRYMVVLMLVIMFVFYLYEYLTKTSRKEERFIDLGFGMAIHIQIGLGILLLIFDIIDGLFEMREMGHIVLMFLLLPLAIVYSKRVKIAPPAIHHMLGLAMPIISIIIIFVALMAIDRPLFGS